MKVAIIAAVCLIVTTAFVFINSAIISDMTQNLTDMLEPIPEDHAHTEEYRAAEEYFLKVRRYMNLTVSHGAILDIESSFSELMGALKAEDNAALTITKSRLLGEISHLRRLSEININSIF